MRSLHAAGASVVIHCHRSVREAHLLADELERQRSGSCAVAVADLRDIEAQLGRLWLPTSLTRFGALALADQ